MIAFIAITANHFGIAHAYDTETVYVQAAQVDLKSAPQAGAAKVTKLRRSDSLQVLKKEGLWYQVKTGAHSGWISRLFVSEHKPVGSAELAKDVGDSLEKASRRRASSYTVSATTRGLQAESRAREGREQYQSDFEALNRMENYRFDPNELDSFIHSANLSTK